MEKWKCKYCRKKINASRKKDHIETRYHKSRARWFKYYSTLDSSMKKLYEDFEQDLLKIDELHKAENDIFNEMDELDLSGYFHNLPDELD